MKEKNKKHVFVLGAGGFIGGHFIKFLKNEGFYLVGVDIKKHVFSKSSADKLNLASAMSFQVELGKHMDGKKNR